jgi:myo-inositol-1(or 4)-monophosphatase
LRAPDDLALLVAAAEEAGAIARRHFRAGAASWDKGGGQGPVSEADLEIDAMLRARLGGARPGYGWLSEETPDDPARLAAEAVFVVDPIDGTRAFLEGQESFAHALAVVRGGRAVAGVVHLPMKGLTYTATAGGGAWLNGRRLLAPAAAPAEMPRVLVSRTQLAPELWPGGVPALDRHFRPSLAWRMCLVAEGAFDAMLSLRDTWHWDIAAGSLIAEEAGARVSDRTGAALTFNTPRPTSAGVLVARPALHAGLTARLRPAA